MLILHETELSKIWREFFSPLFFKSEYGFLPSHSPWCTSFLSSINKLILFWYNNYTKFFVIFLVPHFVLPNYLQSSLGASIVIQQKRRLYPAPACAERIKLIPTYILRESDMIDSQQPVSPTLRVHTEWLSSEHLIKTAYRWPTDVLKFSFTVSISVWFYYYPSLGISWNKLSGSQLIAATERWSY